MSPTSPVLRALLVVAALAAIGAAEARPNGAPASPPVETGGGSTTERETGPPASAVLPVVPGLAEATPRPTPGPPPGVGDGTARRWRGEVGRPVAPSAPVRYGAGGAARCRLVCVFRL